MIGVCEKVRRAYFLLMLCVSFAPLGALDFDAIYAYVAYKSGHYEKALKIYDDIYARSKTCKNAYNLANAHYKLHSFASALKFYKQALELPCAGENALDSNQQDRILQSHQPNNIAESTDQSNQKTPSMCAQAKCKQAFAEPSGIHFREGDTSNGISSRLQRAKIWHNLGNTLFMLERLSESKIAYTNALSLYQTTQSAQNIAYVDEILAKKQSQAIIFKRDFQHSQTPDSHATKFFAPNLEGLHQIPQDSDKTTLETW
ncbi:hypothetical protein CQA49_00535 [Helicobacter sp. MIT 00-7814]|nr:hypothetical protein CQA49_00535 [Helicobacter sp. MIT 00-7814]RDU57736.1 hypothetical protein CQA37_00535 [Helicobacter sp. MIT 99-10781]